MSIKNNDELIAQAVNEYEKKYCKNTTFMR